MALASTPAEKRVVPTATLTRTIHFSLDQRLSKSKLVLRKTGAPCQTKTGSTNFLSASVFNHGLTLGNTNGRQL